jgi:hypothetical protein
MPVMESRADCAADTIGIMLIHSAKLR